MVTRTRLQVTLYVHCLSCLTKSHTRFKFECGRVATFLELYSICAEFKFGFFVVHSSAYRQDAGQYLKPTDDCSFHIPSSSVLTGHATIRRWCPDRPTDSIIKWTHTNRHMTPQYTLQMWELLRANSRQQTCAQDSPTNHALPIFVTLPLALWFLAGAWESLYSTAPRLALGFTQHPISWIPRGRVAGEKAVGTSGSPLTSI